jgi:hypothetical protein
MKKEEILERNRRDSKNAEDEREVYINGKAGLNAKITFTLVVVVISLYKLYKKIPNGDIWCIFMTYCATESIYKYYYLRDKKILLCGVFFIIAAICGLYAFIIST